MRGGGGALNVLVRDVRVNAVYAVHAVTAGGWQFSGVAGGWRERLSQQRRQGTRAKCRRAVVTSSRTPAVESRRFARCDSAPRGLLRRGQHGVAADRARHQQRRARETSSSTQAESERAQCRAVQSSAEQAGRGYGIGQKRGHRHVTHRAHARFLS